ncbi:MAG: hypothetical protein KGH63_04970 [Candidatus Micrarchaeota archaeon]|nr:hypothetical protein [Candidatus Micrarchaeota archaeon]
MPNFGRLAVIRQNEKPYFAQIVGQRVYQILGEIVPLLSDSGQEPAGKLVRLRRDPAQSSDLSGFEALEGAETYCYSRPARGPAGEKKPYFFVYAPVNIFEAQTAKNEYNKRKNVEAEYWIMPSARYP